MVQIFLNISITMANFVAVSLCFGLILIKLSNAYRTDIPEAAEAQYCEFRKHLTIKPTATCCMGKVVKPGIGVRDHWDACVTETAQKSNSAAKIGWDMYSCILKKSSGKDEMSLQEFSDLMTANYPDDIKSKIDGEIKKQSVASASLMNHGKLEKIRVTYFDIEKEVCEGMPSETKEYGKIEICKDWMEENHRGGICCKQSSPIDIRYKSLMEVEDMNDIKLGCRAFAHEHFQKLNVTDTMEENLMEICDIACAMHVAGTDFNFKVDVIDKTEYWKWPTENKYRYNIPQIFHNEMKQQVEMYIASNYSFNSTIMAMQNFEFADVVGGDSNTDRPVHTLTFIARGNKSLGDDFKLDFMRRRFHRYLIHIPIICSAYRETLTLMEHYIFNKESCRPEEPPAETPEEPAPSPPEVTESAGEAGGEGGGEETGEGTTQAPAEA